RHPRLVLELGDAFELDEARAAGHLAAALARDEHDLEDLQVAAAARQHREALDVEHRLEEREKVAREVVAAESERAEEADAVALRTLAELRLREHDAPARHLVCPLDELLQVHARSLVHREHDVVAV